MTTRQRRARPTACKQCGRHAGDVGYISFRALCLDCAMVAQTKSAVEQIAKAGPYYERWRAAMREYAAELDELER